MENKLTRPMRKQRVGVVVSDKMDKTISVEVVRRMKHPKYGKFVTRRKKYLVHDENNEAHIGDTVRIMETRPLSRRKRWRLVQIIERAK
jgi:small subunit ribosomal protein S17